MIAADRQHRGMHHRAAVKHDDIGGAAADIDQRDAEFAFLGKQRRIRRGERLEHQLRGRDPRTLATLSQVGAVALRRGDDMDPRLQAHPRHPDWIAHPFLVIHRELLRQNMQDLAIERDRDGARGIDHAIDIARTDFATAHGNDSMTIESADVRTGDAHGN